MKNRFRPSNDFDLEYRRAQRKTAQILGLALLVISSAVQAAQISWANLPFSNNLTSQGIPLDAQYVFELGVFDNNFVPTAANVDDWVDHWRVADRAHYDPSNAFVSGTYTEATNAPPFTKGQQGYLWGYRDTNEPRGEWILLTDLDWLWPEIDPLAFPLSWLIASSNTRIVGNVDAEGNFTTERVEGASRPRISGDFWRALHFSPTELQDARISGWSSDPDGDGMTNLMEMAFATDPRTLEIIPSGNHSEVQTVTVGNEDYFEMRVSRRADRQIAYIVEVSSDHETWIPAADSGVVVEDSLHRLIVRDGVPLSQSDLRFMRLTVRLQ